MNVLIRSFLAPCRSCHPVAVSLLLCALGCGSTESALPVATPAVGLNRADVPLGGPLEMSYRFTPALDGLGNDDEYRVFVHFLDEITLQSSFFIKAAIFSFPDSQFASKLDQIY